MRWLYEGLLDLGPGKSKIENGVNSHRISTERERIHMGVIGTNIVVAIIVAILSYLFGSIPTGVVIGIVFFHKDIRQYGSGNTGGTNAGRILGKKVGILVITLDMVKTVLPMYVAWAILTYVPGLRDSLRWDNGYDPIALYYWSTILFATFGHCWSIFLKFKGGKAVSCFMGAMVLVSWVQFAALGFLYFFVAIKGKYISLASIVSAAAGAFIAWLIAMIVVCFAWNPYVLTWLFTIPEAPLLGVEYAIVNIIVAAILIIRHRSNIQRLRQGTESINPFLSK